MSISTHVLDTANGKPATGMRVRLVFKGKEIGSACTNEDGRISALLPPATSLQQGIYQIEFATADYFPLGFYPLVSVSFQVRDVSAHYHVPLLLSAFGYTTYRGS